MRSSDFFGRLSRQLAGSGSGTGTGWQELVASNLFSMLSSNTGICKLFRTALIVRLSYGAFNEAIRWSAFLWKYLLSPYPNLRKRYGNDVVHTNTNTSSAPYAIVTGGSKGIGIEIARLLARQGINLVLIARNQADLDAAKQDIIAHLTPNGTTSSGQVDIVLFSMDATNATEGDFDRLLALLKGKHVSILVNNVGVHNDIPVYLSDMTSEEIRRIVNVNCTFQAELTAKVIPLLKACSRSLIMNISSLTSKMAMPLLTCYAATKAFEEHFSVGLAAELQPDNVDVICVRPGLTVSAMSGVKSPSLFVPSAATMARACLRMITASSSGQINADAPYLPHAFLDYVNSWVPSQWTWKIVREMHERKRIEKMG